MNEVADLTAEATGETVGEAKWAALRELERRHPGLDKSAVQFEVVAEGERGILGVGYEPARVLAHLPAEAVGAPLAVGVMASIGLVLLVLTALRFPVLRRSGATDLQPSTL